jgi:hypothetical protein
MSITLGEPKRRINSKRMDIRPLLKDYSAVKDVLFCHIPWQLNIDYILP